MIPSEVSPKSNLISIRRCLFISLLATAFFFASGPRPWEIFPLGTPTAHAQYEDDEETDPEEEEADLNSEEEEDTDLEETDETTSGTGSSNNLDIPEFEEDWSLDEDAAAGEEAPALTWRFSAEFENLFNTRREDHFQDAYEKNEISARVELTYGTSSSFLKSITDVYVMPTFINDEIGDDYFYSPDTEVSRNLRISGRESEVNFRELYVNYPFKLGHIRAGNQVYAWGTADFVNSTAFINPRDFRELLFIDDDHLKLGVPSVSGMIFFDQVTFELVWIPVHVAAAIPPTGHFWAVEKVDDDFPVNFDDSDPLPAESENFGYAARVSSSIRGYDFSFSGYHGPETEPVFRPFRTVLEPNQPLGVLIRPYYDIVDYVGFDFSTTRGDFVFQMEGVYSPNKSGFVEQDSNDPAALDFPFDIKRTDYFAYSVGFNYFIPMHRLLAGHAGDSLFTMEWYQAAFIDEDVNAPLIGNSLVFRYQDEFFDKRVHVSITSILGRENGIIFWPQLAYDFKNGFMLELDYAAINGDPEDDWEDSSIYYFYRQNDFIMVTLQYAYP